ncbi:circadian clock KaiB family protein [Plectonema cf. radiosum LEGE 06105]|uniref:Circadian clock KaiB family protein n=1 Tax=Plectonema cf. radiosum LEGE 06105 TaxID=945769 RepID=A0A8J7F9I6_9CYAN|nr:circadian clock KaiB family protein [Plectonema radiosum]MBE9216860.1 circadian clock KaiB family protein [Plectonema cf. radiosum LEGE 06105]
MCKCDSNNIYILKLYVTGDTPRSNKAISNLNELCQANLANQFKIIIVDVLKQPDIAEKEKIIVTPTLVKESPFPQMRIIGDLSDVETVLMGLGIGSKKHDIFSE